MEQNSLFSETISSVREYTFQILDEKSDVNEKPSSNKHKAKLGGHNVDA